MPTLAVMELPKAKIDLKNLKLNVLDYDRKVIWTTVPFWQNRGHLITNGNYLQFPEVTQEEVKIWGVEAVGPDHYAVCPLKNGVIVLKRGGLASFSPHSIEIKLGG